MLARRKQLNVTIIMLHNVSYKKSELVSDHTRSTTAWYNSTIPNCDKL